MSSYVKRAAMIGAGLAARDAYSTTKRMVGTMVGSKKKRRVYKPRYLRPAGTITSFKRHQETNNVTSRKLHALYDDLISAIPQGSEINQRERQQIMLRGVKLNFWAKVLPTADLASADLGRLRIVLAINRYRDQPYTVGGADSNEDLFKGLLNASVTDFTVHSNGLNSTTLPINTRKWKVLFDRSYDFKADSGYNTIAPNTRIIEAYIPCNEKLTWEGTGSTEGNNPLIMLWWYENPSWSALGESTTTPFQDRSVVNLYYNDII